ncbi:Zinc finger BED domain-containing, partial [Abortiporus biennis]
MHRTATAPTPVPQPPTPTIPTLPPREHGNPIKEYTSGRCQTSSDQSTACSQKRRKSWFRSHTLVLLDANYAVDDQAINVVECLEFWNLLLFLNSDLSDKDIPHCMKMANLVMQTFETEYERMIAALKSSLGRISFTYNLWTSQNLLGIMALTAHHLSKDEHGNLIYKSHLLTFRVIKGSHGGEHMADIWYKIVKEAGIENWISQITSDNASSNDVFMARCEDFFHADGIPFDRDGNHVRCFPYITNIATQTILKELKENPEASMFNLAASAVKESDWDQFMAYSEALSKDPVGRIQSLVATCRASSEHRREFKAIIQVGNELKKWESPDGTLPVLQLLQDAETRWSSTYLMIDHALFLYPAVKAFISNRSD